jgi:xanthine dehydrogenase accessory factor
MKIWNETAWVYGELAQRLARGETAAVATLIRLEGSSYRRPGAKLLIAQDGTLVGNVSGGCLEEDLRERGRRVQQTGRPERVHYDTGSDENVVWGLGLGCDGRLDLWLQPFRPGDQAEVVAALLERLRGRTPFFLKLSMPEGRLELPVAGEAAGEDFVEHLEPPADLVVVGAGEDARPVVRLAAEAGFRVTVVDHRSAFLTPERFPAAQRLVAARPEKGLGDLPAHGQTLVILMTHAVALDRAWARLWADTSVSYIGLLGPQARRAEITRHLPPASLPRVYGPVGLDLGAEGAEQIALSILAEALAVRAGRDGGHLRARTAPLHA